MLKTADINADKLMRLRSNRHLWGAPPPYCGQGRPRVHGACFKLNDPTTWHGADQDITVAHPKLGLVRVRSWHSMHFRQAAQHSMTLIQVQRLDETEQPCSTRPLWLVWVGDARPDLEYLWQCYLRRFALEHWYRFLKQRLHWTLPRLGEPKAAERWSDLMPLATWQLWLARDIVRDAPLPWQKTLPFLTPGRVADSIAPLLARLGSPTTAPKPRGKSPGWAKDQKRNRKPRYPTVRKRVSRPKKNSKSVA
ncbi:MAG TPA: hypothetical protein V6C88_03260 [Chroococcidiopsis sp.]